MSFRVHLADVCDVIRGVSYRSSDYTAKDDPKGREFVNLKCVSASGFRMDGVKYYKGVYRADQGVNHGDLLIANTDLTRNREVIGNSILIPKTIRNGCFSMDLSKLLIKDADCLDKVFLYYYLKSPVARGYMINSSDGSTVVHLPLQAVRDMPLELPDINTQRKIAKLLMHIDNKIIVNTCTNDNLEKLLRLKFDHWIAGLSSAKSSNLAEIADYKNGLAMQKFRPKTGDGLPVIKIKEMNSGFSNDTERCDESISKEYIIHDGDMLFAWSGSLCTKIWCGGVGGLNQHIFKVTSDKYPKWFYYLWTLHHLDKFIQIAAGKATTMGHIKRKELSLSEVLIPETQELESMDKIMSPLLEKYISNNIENRRLSTLRDTLLPELMNGKIDLSKVEV